MKILKRWAWAYNLQASYGKPTSERIKSLWREGWVQYPAVMTSGLITIAGFALGMRNLWHAYHRPPEKYLRDYIVFRSDDPRVKRINHYCHLD